MAKITPPGMMEALIGRHSVTDFSSKKVQKKDLGLILEAARWAPSVLNLQPWEFVVVEKSELIERLNNTVAYRVHTSPPPAIIAIVLKGDYLSEEYDMERNRVPACDAQMSLSMPAIHMCLMASSLGLSSCILTPHKPTAKSVLLLKASDSVPIMVAIGHAPRDAKMPPRKRKTLKEITRIAK